MAEVNIQMRNIADVTLTLTEGEAVALDRFLFSGAWPSFDKDSGEGVEDARARAMVLVGIYTVLRSALNAAGVDLIQRDG